MYTQIGPPAPMMYPGAPAPTMPLGTTMTVAPAQFNGPPGGANSKEALFNAIDRNNDGVITRDEIQAYKDPPAPLMYPGAPAPTMPLRTTMIGAPAQFNGPTGGANSKEALFNAIDRNNDGVLTPDEIQAYKDQQQGHASREVKVQPSDIDALLDAILDGHRHMQTDIAHIKSQINANYEELQDLRRRITHMGQSGPAYPPQQPNQTQVPMNTFGAGAHPQNASGVPANFQGSQQRPAVSSGKKFGCC